jgi:aspartyl-tRNA(Asn)/glutamyl-tRNA(Gln) amidotransferase subunit C
MEIEELQTTARLAHLNMGEAELAAAFPAFEQMLGFFAAMQAADNDDAAFPAGLGGDGTQADSAALVKPAAHFRPDSLVNGAGATDEAMALVKNAGDRDGRFIVAPNVL